MKSKFIRRRVVAIALVFILLIGGIALANRSSIRSFFDSVTGADYNGSGHGSAVSQISAGDDGATVSQELVDLGVVKTYRTIYKLVIARNFVFYPGSYQLKLQMSSPAALDALANPANRISNKVTIKEGLRLGQVFDALAKATDIPRQQFETASKDLAGIGVAAHHP